MSPGMYAIWQARPAADAAGRERPLPFCLLRT